MNLFLIRATGHTGHEIVKQGLAAGHEITALVRDASKVAVSDPHLHLVTTPPSIDSDSGFEQIQLALL